MLKDEKYTGSCPRSSSAIPQAIRGWCWSTRSGLDSDPSLFLGWVCQSRKEAWLRLAVKDLYVNSLFFLNSGEQVLGHKELVTFLHFVGNGGAGQRAIRDGPQIDIP